jgi:hypothetical protein
MRSVLCDIAVDDTPLTTRAGLKVERVLRWSAWVEALRKGCQVLRRQVDGRVFDPKSHDMEVHSTELMFGPAIGRIS